jgi:heme/copper-type cytochrome/quinol oxidase subunit 2
MGMLKVVRWADAPVLSPPGAGLEVVVVGVIMVAVVVVVVVVVVALVVVISVGELSEIANSSKMRSTLSTGSTEVNSTR